MKVQWEIEYLPSLKLSPAKYWFITKGKMVTFQWRKPEDTTLTAMKTNLNITGSEKLSLHSTPLGNALGRAHCFWCIPARKIWLESNREETPDISNWVTFYRAVERTLQKWKVIQRKREEHRFVPTKGARRLHVTMCDPRLDLSSEKKGTSGMTDELRRRFCRLRPS